MPNTRKPVSASAVSLPITTILGALFALALMLVLPTTARAQSDAIRVMAGRVLGDRVLDEARRDRDGGIWRDDRRDDDRRGDDGRYESRRVDNRRDVQRIRKEQQAREKYCRKNPRERVCREWFGYDYGRLDNRRGNNASWCWDRNRDGRCDAGVQNRRFPGRGLALGRR